MSRRTRSQSLDLADNPSNSPVRRSSRIAKTHADSPIPIEKKSPKVISPRTTSRKRLTQIKEDEENQALNKKVNQDNAENETCANNEEISPSRIKKPKACGSCSSECSSPGEKEVQNKTVPLRRSLRRRTISIDEPDPPTSKSDKSPIKEEKNLVEDNSETENPDGKCNLPLRKRKYDVSNVDADLTIIKEIDEAIESIDTLKKHDQSNHTESNSLSDKNGLDKDKICLSPIVNTSKRNEDTESNTNLDHKPEFTEETVENSKKDHLVEDKILVEDNVNTDKEKVSTEIEKHTDSSSDNESVIFSLPTIENDNAILTDTNNISELPENSKNNVEKIKEETQEQKEIIEENSPKETDEDNCQPLNDDPKHDFTGGESNKNSEKELLNDKNIEVQQEKIEIETLNKQNKELNEKGNEKVVEKESLNKPSEEISVEFHSSNDEKNDSSKSIEQNDSNTSIEENDSNKSIEQNDSNTSIEENDSNKSMEENVSPTIIKCSNKEISVEIESSSDEVNISSKSNKENMVINTMRNSGIIIDSTDYVCKKKSDVLLSPDIKNKLSSLLHSTEDSIPSNDEESDSNQSNYGSSSSESEINEYFDDMAEEVNEEEEVETDENEIVEKGESINSTDSEFSQDEDYDYNDSFIVDEEIDELLSGEEYDLEIDNENDNKVKKKRKRIIENNQSSSDDDIHKNEIPKSTKNDSKIKKKRKRIIENVESSSDDDINQNELPKSTKNESNIKKKRQQIIENVQSSSGEDITKNEIVESTANEIKNVSNSNIESPNKTKNPKSMNGIFSSTPNKFDTNKSPNKDNVSTTKKSPCIKIHENIVLKQPIYTKNENSLDDSKAINASQGKTSSIVINESVNVNHLTNNLIKEKVEKIIDVFISSAKTPKDIRLNLSLEYKENGEVNKTEGSLTINDEETNQPTSSNSNAVKEVSVNENIKKSRKRKRSRKQKQSSQNSENIVESLENTNKTKNKHKKHSKNIQIDKSSVNSINQKNTQIKESTSSQKDKKQTLNEDVKNDGQKKRRRGKTQNSLKQLNNFDEEPPAKKNKIELNNARQCLFKNTENNSENKALKVEEKMSNIDEKSKTIKRKKNKQKNNPILKETFQQLLNEGLVTDVKNRPRRTAKPKISPEGWLMENCSINPSTTNSIKNDSFAFSTDKLEKRDFKNKTLFDPTRIKREESKKVLRKKGFFI